MGADFIARTCTGPDAGEALAAMCARIEGQCYDWHDPSTKPGYVQVWDKPVVDCAIGWMRGVTEQQPPAGVDPDDKWGPWMMFPLASGGWHFFGWVNT